MKAAALVALVLTVALPSGKGKGNAAACSHFDVKGTLRSTSAASFALEQATKHGGRTLRVAITSTTEVFWTSRGTLSGPVAGDRVWAKGRRCGDTYTATWVLVTAK